MLSPAQSKTIVELQDKMNCTVDPAWVESKNDFLLAVAMESAEAIDHLGTWKWWKASSTDLEQLRLELVDILHFLVSQIILETSGDLLKAACVLSAPWDADSVIVDGKPISYAALTCTGRLKLQMALGSVGRYCLGLFHQIVNDSQMTVNDLFNRYVSKNVLNNFRQAQGYKDGSYTKIWGGREDNDHLVEIMHQFDSCDSAFTLNIEEALNARYISFNKQ